MNWNEFAQEVHQVAAEKGWWDEPVSFDDFILMCHCELSEAVEEWRKGRPNFYYPCELDDGGPCTTDNNGDYCALGTDSPCEHRGTKPEGVAVELGDVILRILDWLGSKDGVHSPIAPAYPKLPFSLIVNQLHATLVKAWSDDDESVIEMRLCCIVSIILAWAEREGVDMEAVLREKHEFNKTRDYRHGGKRV